MNPRRLYRSRDRMLAGVAGGMAEYLDMDPTIVRILWIIVGIFSGGLALIAYVIMALVVPPAPVWANPGLAGPYAASAAGPGAWTATPAWGTGPDVPPAPDAVPQWNPDWAARAAAEEEARRQARGRGIGIGAIVGVVLVVFGAIALADELIPFWSGAAMLGPAVIIALGAALLVGSIRTRSEAPATTAPATTSFAEAAPPVADPVPASDPVPATPLVTTAGAYETTDTESVGDLAPRG